MATEFLTGLKKGKPVIFWEERPFRHINDRNSKIRSKSKQKFSYKKVEQKHQLRSKGVQQDIDDPSQRALVRPKLKTRNYDKVANTMTLTEEQLNSLLNTLNIIEESSINNIESRKVDLPIQQEDKKPSVPNRMAISTENESNSSNHLPMSSAPPILEKPPIVIGRVHRNHMTKAERKRLEMEEVNENQSHFDPWGRPGAGAPHRIPNGEVIANIPNQIVDRPGESQSSDLHSSLMSSISGGIGVTDNQSLEQTRKEQKAAWLEELQRQRDEERARKTVNKESRQLDDTWADRLGIDRRPKGLPYQDAPLSIQDNSLRSSSAPQVQPNSIGEPSIFHRGKNAFLDAKSLEELEEKRKRQLVHQQAIREQVEEQQRRRMRQRDLERQEEMAWEEKIEAERARLMAQYKSDQNKIKEKEENERRRMAALTAAMNEAQQAAELEKEVKRRKQFGLESDMQLAERNQIEEIGIEEDTELRDLHSDPDVEIELQDIPREVAELKNKLNLMENKLKKGKQPCGDEEKAKNKAAEKIQKQQRRWGSTKDAGKRVITQSERDPNFEKMKSQRERRIAERRKKHEEAVMRHANKIPVGRLKKTKSDSPHSRPAFDPRQMKPVNPAVQQDGRAGSAPKPEKLKPISLNINQKNRSEYVPSMPEVEFSPFRRSQDVLNPVDASKPLVISRESSSVENARLAHLASLRPGHGIVDDINSEQQELPSMSMKDPILNPSVILDHPTSRQYEILQQLSSIKQGLLLRQRELHASSK